MRSFFRKEGGITAVEFAIVAPVFFMFIFGIVDFSRMLWQYNKFEKAAQFGVRSAAVSDLVAVDLDFNGVNLVGGNGLPIPASAVNGGAPITCVSTGVGDASCDWGASDPAAFETIFQRIRMIAPEVDYTNVQIIYQHIGIGWSGNPYGPDIWPLITVRLTGLPFQFVTPGLANLVDFTWPDFEVSMTAEDMSS